MAQRKTKAQFIQDARKVHGDKYDYSLVEYVNSNTKVKIICPEHGVFEQTANNHLRERGCAKCAGKGKTTSEFIEQARKVHGDRYDYSLTQYIGATQKVKVVCNKHGVFEQIAFVHLSGAGCLACGGCQKRTTSEFIQFSLAIHGDKYDYSLVDYVNNQGKVKIICRKHGLFEQRPACHTKGKGCDKCAAITRGRKRRKSKAQFIQDAQKIHGDKYDYSLVEYVNSQEKIKIICPEHGVFEQIPNNHLKGRNCPVCSGRYKTKLDFIHRAKSNHGNKYDYSLVDYTHSEAKVKIVCPEHGIFEQRAICHARGQGCPMCIGRMKTTDKLIEDFVLVHADKYDYSLVEYVDSNTKVKIICPEHGVFEQIPSNHLTGKGCIDCAEYGFRGKKPGVLYFVKLQKDFATFWKIGITNRTIEDRFQQDALFIQYRKEWQFNEGIYAHQVEQQVLKQFQDYKQPPMLFPLLHRGGDTECFTPNLPYKKVVDFINKEVKRLTLPELT